MTGTLAINTVRVAPIGITSGSVSAVVFGRTYTCAHGATLDVIEGDASALAASGKFFVMGTSGPTSQRPAYPPTATSESRIVGNPVGTRYIDTTLGVDIIHNGVGWVNAATGAAV